MRKLHETESGRFELDIRKRFCPGSPGNGHGPEAARAAGMDGGIAGGSGQHLESMIPVDIPAQGIL